MRPELLSSITSLLQENATNYSVFLQVYRAPDKIPKDPVAVIHACLGADATAGGVEEVGPDDVCNEVEEALFFPGDDGAGPAQSTLASGIFVNLISQLKTELLQLANDSQNIQKFWLQDGHPAYPVFWDFAYIFWGAHGATLFIGSSSD